MEDCGRKTQNVITAVEIDVEAMRLAVQSLGKADEHEIDLSVVYPVTSTVHHVNG